MKQMYLLLLVLLLSCIACGQKNPEISTESSEILINEPATEASLETESEEKLTEEAKMKREFCNVIEINEDYMLLKNVYNETYQIDGSYNNEYEEGDEVVLSYKERTQIKDNVYEVCPEGLFRSSSQVAFPMK